MHLLILFFFCCLAIEVIQYFKQPVSSLLLQWKISLGLQLSEYKGIQPAAKRVAGKQELLWTTFRGNDKYICYHSLWKISLTLEQAL